MSEEPKESNWRDLGDANGWGKDPDPLILCRQQKHVLTDRTIGRCYTQYSCLICRISFNVDSSD